MPCSATWSKEAFLIHETSFLCGNQGGQFRKYLPDRIMTWFVAAGRIFHSAGETMSDPQGQDTQGQLDSQPQAKKQERRSQPRGESVLERIEDATYAILRKHENKTA
jgi:hypothetical protein